jgi:hypothetical protein
MNLSPSGAGEGPAVVVVTGTAVVVVTGVPMVVAVTGGLVVVVARPTVVVVVGSSCVVVVMRSGRRVSWLPIAGAVVVLLAPNPTTRTNPSSPMTGISDLPPSAMDTAPLRLVREPDTDSEFTLDMAMNESTRATTRTPAEAILCTISLPSTLVVSAN